MNGVTVIVAPVTGAPTTPDDIALTCTTQVLLLKPGGEGTADISLKSSSPALPACSSPRTYMSPRPLLMHASASSASGVIVLLPHAPAAPQDKNAASDASERTRRMDVLRMGRHKLPSYAPSRRAVRSRRLTWRSHVRSSVVG